jgi:hypothetical protein
MRISPNRGGQMGRSNHGRPEQKKCGAVVMARGAKLVGFAVVKVKNRTKKVCLKSLIEIY